MYCDSLESLSLPLSPPARVVWIEMYCDSLESLSLPLSPPARVVWIEIGHKLPEMRAQNVATREGGVD